MKKPSPLKGRVIGPRPAGWVNPLKGKPRPHKRIPLEARFWSKVDRRGPEDCWEWKAHIQTAGYGQFHVGMVKGEPWRQPAHRVSWEMANGPIPDGMVIDHICKNTKCVNPAHLRVVTQAANCTVLASGGPFKRNLERTACPKGHPYTPANTARPPRKDGKAKGRICLACYPWYWRYADVPRDPPPPGYSSTKAVHEGKQRGR